MSDFDLERAAATATTKRVTDYYRHYSHAGRYGGPGDPVAPAKPQHDPWADFDRLQAELAKAGMTIAPLPASPIADDWPDIRRRLQDLERRR